EKMEEVNSIIGGEGNGGVMDPRIHYARDSIVGMGLILESMARSGMKCSEAAAALPQYSMLKTKIDCPTAKSREVIRALKTNAQTAQSNTLDGLRLDWDDRWVHLRASNT